MPKKFVKKIGRKSKLGYFAQFWPYIKWPINRQVSRYNRPINRSFFRRLIGRLIGIGRSLVISHYLQKWCNFKVLLLFGACWCCASVSYLPLIKIYLKLIENGYCSISDRFYVHCALYSKVQIATIFRPLSNWSKLFKQLL